MPQVQVVDTTENKPEPTGVEEFFSKLGKSFKDENDRVEIGNILKSHHENRKDVSSLIDTYAALDKSNISPTKRLQAKNELMEIEKLIQQRDKDLNAQVKTLQTAQKERDEKKRSQESVYELYKPHMPEEEARRLSLIDNEATARSKITQLTKKEKAAPASQFEKTLQAEEAKKLVKLEEDIPKARDALANLDRIEQLANNELSGLKGYTKAAIRSESAEEMKNLSFTSIEPIIKLFNPVGPIPVQKVKIIQQQFQAYPSDRLSTVKGKVAALRRIGQQGLARAEQRAALIRQHKGNVPSETIQQFDSESSQLQDALVDQESFSIKLKENTDTDLIDGLYSAKDGRKLKPIPKKEAEKLYEQGLITNVPPG